MGDFVEFTGDTSVWESLSGPFNYQYSKSFKIMTLYSGSDVENVTFGVFYINPTSSQCRLIVCDKDGIKKVTNLSGIDFSGATTIDDIYLSTSPSVLYVTISSLKKVYMFNYNSSNNTITYNGVVTVTVPTYPDSVTGTKYYGLLCVRNSKIYCYATTNASGASQYIYKLNLNGSTVEETYNFNYSSGDPDVLKCAAIDNYLIFYPQSISTSSNKAGVVINLNTSIVTTTTGLPEYFSHTYYGKLVRYNNYFFLVGFAKPSINSGTAYLQLTVFYLDENENIQIVDNYRQDTGSGTANENGVELIVEENNNNYRIVCVTHRGNYTFFYIIYNFDINGSDLTRLSYGEIQDELREISGVDNVMLFDISDVYNMFYTHSANVSSNYLCRTKFTINNNQLVQVEALDHVKPYENTINGVAKTSGNVGQEISIYIP